MKKYLIVIAMCLLLCFLHIDCGIGAKNAYESPNGKIIPNSSQQYATQPGSAACTFNYCTKDSKGNPYCATFSKTLGNYDTGRANVFYGWGDCDNDKASYKEKYGLCKTTADCCSKGTAYPSTKCDTNKKKCVSVLECGKQECTTYSDCCSKGQTYPYYACTKNYGETNTCVAKYECGVSECDPSKNKRTDVPYETFNEVCNRYECNTESYQCFLWTKGRYTDDPLTELCKSDQMKKTSLCKSIGTGDYAKSSCQSACRPPSTKPTPTTPPSSTTTTTGSSSSSSTIKPITSTTGKPRVPEDESCSIIQFKITPNLASLLALSEGKVHFTAYWSTLYCNSCELWYLPVDSDEQPLRNKDGTQMEYTKVASNLPFESPDPTYEWDENNLYYIKNYPQKWGHYLYKLICKGSKNEYESFPVHIFVAPWMIWYEVPPVMPTSKFHTIITSPGWGQSIEEYKGY